MFFLIWDKFWRINLLKYFLWKLISSIDLKTFFDSYACFGRLWWRESLWNVTSSLENLYDPYLYCMLVLPGLLHISVLRSVSVRCIVFDTTSSQVSNAPSVSTSAFTFLLGVPFTCTLKILCPHIIWTYSPESNLWISLSSKFGFPRD